MRPLVFFLFTSLALAQQGEDARSLLQQVADAARNVKSWRAEYVATIEVTAEGVQSKMEMPARESSRSPNLIRREITLAGIPALIVCDGASAWTYMPASKRYQKTTGTSAVCVSPFSTWAQALNGLQSAVITGRETLVFEGIPTPCDVVRAEYVRLPSGTNLPGGTVTVGTGTRTMCVDRSRLLILRDYIETKAIPTPSSPNGVQSKATIVYSSIERDPVLPLDSFTFEPPADSTLIAGPASALSAPARSSSVPLPPGVYSVGNGVTSPALISKVEPAYTQEARAAKIDGTVILYLEVNPEGVPQNMRVLRSLEPGLDQNAIYAVSQWRFRPGMKDGQPVTVAAQVEVNFRLLQGPPPRAILP
jgi:TonB family protein